MNMPGWLQQIKDEVLATGAWSSTVNILDNEGEAFDEENEIQIARQVQVALLAGDDVTGVCVIDVVERMESFVVDEYKKGGVTAQAKARLDKVIDAMQKSCQRARRGASSAIRAFRAEMLRNVHGQAASAGSESSTPRNDSNWVAAWSSSLVRGSGLSSSGSVARS